MVEAEALAPFANNRIAKFLTKRLEELGGSKTYRQIAYEMGIRTPNVISMMKMGQTKVPLDRIPGLARALDVDPVELFRMALEQYWSNDLEAIDKVFGTIVTANEAEIVKVIRDAVGGYPEKLSSETEAKLRKLFATQ